MNDIFPWLDNRKAPTDHERDRASTIVADRLCSAAANPTEARRQAIQAALDARKSAAERNRLGQFATPNDLAIEIARYLRSVAGRRLRAVRFADPAIGTGSFYSAALAVFDPDDVQFGDALVSSVVLVFRKMVPSPAHAVEFTFGGTIGEPRASDSIPLDQLRESRKWTVYPHHARNDRRTSSNGDGSTLGHFFRIQPGAA